PLTVMSGIIVEQQQQQKTAALNELRYQIDKMNSTIGYQLKRAVSTSAGLSIQRVKLLPLLQSICSAMDKVYAHKAMAIHLDLDEEIEFNGDENDVMEVLANLIDNACKYGQNTVEVCCQWQQAALHITVCDDGPGIEPGQRELVTQRGKRLDSVESGQGLGLALVKDILDAYSASLTIEDSPLGGACFRITWPGQRAA
ncbi:MAG: ATP-binding protein, partial [Pseudomonadota bacterium]